MMPGDNKSYLEQCIEALPPEKREAARCAFYEISETGDDSYAATVEDCGWPARRRERCQRHWIWHRPAGWPQSSARVERPDEYVFATLDPFFCIRAGWNLHTTRSPAHNGPVSFIEPVRPPATTTMPSCGPWPSNGPA